MDNQLPTKIVEQIRDSANNKLLDGCIRFVETDQLTPILKAGYIHADEAVPFAITAFGDILTWEKGKYICKVSFIKCSTEVLAAGTKYFFDDLTDPDYVSEKFDIELYRHMKTGLGSLNGDECYGYVPLIPLGGDINTAHIRRVKYREYLYLAIQMNGGIQ